MKEKDNGGQLGADWGGQFTTDFPLILQINNDNMIRRDSFLQEIITKDEFKEIWLAATAKSSDDFNESIPSRTDHFVEVYRPVDSHTFQTIDTFVTSLETKIAFLWEQAKKTHGSKENESPR